MAIKVLIDIFDDFKIVVYILFGWMAWLFVVESAINFCMQHEYDL